MQPLDPAGVYSDTAVKQALSGQKGTRVMAFRYDRLDVTNKLIAPLDGVTAGTVRNNNLADIKRTASFTLLDYTGLNYLSDRIRPWARLAMPDGGWVEWPLGVFLLSTPTQALSQGGVLSRAITAYDQLQVLTDDKTADRYSVAAGTLYTDAINTLIATVTGLGGKSVVPSTLTLPVAMEWEPGTTKLKILNDLLAAINYSSAWFDELGILQCRPYQSPADKAVEYTYADDTASVRTGEAERTLDLFSVPNKWVVVKSEPDQDPLVASYTNVLTTSPTSTVGRGRTIVDYRTETDAADATTLAALAARYAFEASQVYETVKVNTLLMPMHSNADVLAFTIPGLSVSAKYGETAWELPLKAGATMSHSVRRVVNV